MGTPTYGFPDIVEVVASPSSLYELLSLNCPGYRVFGADRQVFLTSLRYKSCRGWNVLTFGRLSHSTMTRHHGHTIDRGL